jgi:serine-type D-Ala-D-Ala carboxypeptidase/endopeptidase (penicillin-binding protein 4)
MKTRSIITLFIMLGSVWKLSFAVSSDNNGERLRKLIEKYHYPLSNVAVLVKKIEKNSIVASLNAEEPFNPASVSKLTTAAMAFEKLGTAYTFKTQVYTDGIYSPDSGIVNGNLYIKGNGDPLFVIERIWIFVQYLHNFYGLKSIKGDIVLDDSFFDTVSTGPCFMDDSMKSNPYAAPVGALCANFNIVQLCIRPGMKDDPVVAHIFPELPNVSLTVKAKTIATSKKTGVYVESELNGEGNTRITLAGSMSYDAEPKIILRKVRQTWEHFGNIFRMFLDENRIAVGGKVRRGIVPDQIKYGKPMYVWESPPLREIVTDMMKYSTNLSAEMIFKTFSALCDSGNGSWEKSAGIASGWWKEKGLPGSPTIRNGSGMGDCNRYSASQIAALLSYIWTQKNYLPEYLNAFPVSGTDGTLRSRFKDSRLKGFVRGKTGTLNEFGVYTMAGYVLMPDDDYVFVIMFNNMNSKYPYRHWEMQQKILETLIR